MLELIRERLKGFFAINITEEPGMKNNKRPGFKIKKRLARFLAFVIPETEKRITLFKVNTIYDQLIAKYEAIFEIHERTINTLEECINTQAETIASLDSMDELREKENKLLKDEIAVLEEIKHLQDYIIRLLEEHDAFKENMIIKLIDRLNTASQKYNDPSLIDEEMLTLREELLVKDNVAEMTS